jgi:hypothetical protein
MKNKIYPCIVALCALVGCGKPAPVRSSSKVAVAASIPLPLSAMPDSIISNDSATTYVYAGGKRVTRLNSEKR